MLKLWFLRNESLWKSQLGLTQHVFHRNSVVCVCVHMCVSNMPVVHSHVLVCMCVCVFLSIHTCVWSACSADIPSCFPGSVLTLLVHLLFLTLAASTVIPTDTHTHTRTHTHTHTHTHRTQHITLPLHLVTGWTKNLTDFRTHPFLFLMIERARENEHTRKHTHTHTHTHTQTHTHTHNGKGICKRWRGRNRKRQVRGDEKTKRERGRWRSDVGMCGKREDELMLLSAGPAHRAWLMLGRCVCMCVYSCRSAQGVSTLHCWGTCFLKHR